MLLVVDFAEQFAAVLFVQLLAVPVEYVPDAQFEQLVEPAAAYVPAPQAVQAPLANL